MRNKYKKYILPIILLVGCIFIILVLTKEPSQPINRGPTLINIPEQIINEGETFHTLELKSYVTDPDNDPSDIKWNFDRNKSLTIRLTEDHILQAYPPDENWFGTDTIRITATDPDGLSASSKITFSVLPVNDKPIILFIPGQTISEGETFAKINLNNYVTDIDNSSSEMKWRFSCNKLNAVKIGRDNIAVITPLNENFFGTDTIRFIVTDPGHISAVTRVIFQILPVNDTPVIQAIHSQTIYEGKNFPVLKLNDYIFDIDNSIDQLKCSVSGNKFLQIQIDDNNQAMVSSPDPDWFGGDTMIFRVTDPGNLTASTQVIFNIIPVNDAPTLSEIPEQVIKEYEAFKKILLDDYINDVDNKSEEINWEVSGNKYLIVRLLDNYMEINYPVDWYGSDTLLFTATDPGGLTATIQTVFTVLEKTFWEKQPFKDIRNISFTGTNDLLSLIFSPYHWETKDLLTFGSVISISALSMNYDEDIQRKIADKNEPESDILKFGEIYGRDITSIAASLSFGAFGFVSDNQDFTQIGLEIIESYLIVNHFTMFLKNAFGRARPSLDEGSNNFYLFAGKGDQYHSLPSNHAALAFSLSSVLAAHTENYFLKTIIFTPALLTAAERISSNSHWFSDVFLGGAIGYFVADFIVNRHKQNNEEDIIFGISPSGQIGLVYMFK
ncbi:MAG: hypothetical protein A2V66_15175 [Ignavibacteria bacterium RBG_13_36_8]|nr:MAG: hypothetical protein A2V66_15175 [Ignavibacteria bacterium RBG_13_36_8]